LGRKGGEWLGVPRIHMILMITPIYGNGWLGPCEGHMDVPEPFVVDDVLSSGKEKLSVVNQPGHLFHSMVMRRALRFADGSLEYRPYDVELFLKDDFDGSAIRENRYPEYCGYALIHPV
jgi:hypothetical protein